MTRQVIQRDKLGELTKIGQGGQGVVYRAPNVTTKFAASMVYKEYKPAARTEIDFTVLAAMPALVEESLSYAQAERLISIAAWPCALVEDAATPTGFVMPAIPEEFFISLTTAKGVAASTPEFQHLHNHRSVLAARGITVDDAQRCTLLRETASALAFLHKHGVCVGDISPKNLLFSLTPREAVYFIDCDAMRIHGVSALPQVETPGWNTPAGEELATVYSDTYKLGLLALRLLTGDQDTTNPGHLPATTPALLRQIITDTLTKPPHQRPLPEAWTYVLGHAIEHAQHQQKTPPPVGAPPAPPPIPTVHSRPPAHSGPPVGPSGPPVPPPRPAHRPPVHPAQPAEWPPTEIGTPQPWGQRPRRQVKVALIAAIVVVLAAGTGITGYLLRQPSTISQPSTTSTTAPTTTAPITTTPTTAPPVAEAALEGLLLSPDQINTAMGATGMTVTGTFNGLGTPDNLSDTACLPLDDGPTTPVYAGSGWSALRGQQLSEPGQSFTTFTHLVLQDVVLFSSAHDAGAFFTASAQRWPACANRQYTRLGGGPEQVMTAGPVSNANGTLSATQTGETVNNWIWQSCQRALTVANNVVIDINACSKNRSDSAVNIARQIAAKVPTA